MADLGEKYPEFEYEITVRKAAPDWCTFTKEELKFNIKSSGFEEVLDRSLDRVIDHDPHDSLLWRIVKIEMLMK